MTSSPAPSCSSPTPWRKRFKAEVVVCAATLALLATVLSPGSFGQTGPSITVRVLNEKDGKPVKDIFVSLFDQNKRTRIPTTSGKVLYQSRFIASAHTDVRGLAVLKLSQPIPEKVTVSYGDIYRLDQCVSHMQFTTADILATGVVAPITSPRCPPSKVRSAVIQKPGELVLFGKVVSRWERMKRSD